jgi:hypothetical protein
MELNTRQEISQEQAHSSDDSNNPPATTKGKEHISD